MSTHAKSLWVITGVSVIVLSLASSAAFARDEHDRRDGHDNHAVVAHQPRHETVIISGRKYDYHDGRFFRPGFFGYTAFRPPLGAVIVSLPAGYTTVIIGGTTYYCYDDLFFRSYPTGYLVVPPPVVYSSAAPMPPAVNLETAPAGETVVINVPNARGGYTAVTLVKTNNGYIGPQGEFYSEHPTVNQLKALYGR